MPSTPAISLVKPLPKPIRACPYCDHISPADSKFCSACGAALHLMPCPHCGAVNDITTSTACYRCHRELHEKSAESEPPSSVTIEPEPVPVESAHVEPQSRHRPHGLVVLIVLLAFGAASYYAFRQRGTLEVREPAASGAEATGRVSPAAPGGSAAPVASPAQAPASINGTSKGNAADSGAVTAVPEKTVPAPVASNPQTSAGNVPATARTAIPPAAPPAPAEYSRARIDASKGIEKQAPNIGPCTEAVAALGLCTPDPTQKR